MKMNNLKTSLNSHLTSLPMMKKIGLKKEPLPQLKTKVNADHVGLSQPLETWKDKLKYLTVN
jgi:hypothetical protein